MLRSIARNFLPLRLRVALRHVFPVDPNRLALAEVAARIAAADGTQAPPAPKEEPPKMAQAAADLFHLAYGSEPDDELREKLDFVCAEMSSSGLRSLISVFDRQTYPTPISVRFAKSELACAELEGVKLWLDRSDYAVSAAVINHGAYEPHMVAFLKEHVRKGMTVVDIGANVGIFSMLAASQGAKVCAFEPNTENCRLILMSAAENGFEVKLFPLALSNHAGAVFFTPHIGSNGGLLPNRVETLSNPNCIVVPAMRLDELVFGRVDFIKADVEGAEYLALKGGEQLIREYKPIITIELSMEMIQRVSGIDGIDFIRWIQSMGYRAFLIGRNGQKTDIGNLDTFRNEWGDLSRIEDIAFVPL